MRIVPRPGRPRLPRRRSTRSFSLGLSAAVALHPGLAGPPTEPHDQSPAYSGCLSVSLTGAQCVHLNIASPDAPCDRVVPMTSATPAKSSASCASRGGADTQARGDGRRTRGSSNGVAVDGRPVQQILGLLTVELGVNQVNEDEVHVGAARDQLDASLLSCIVSAQALSDDLRALEGAALAALEFGLRDLHGDGLHGHVHEGPPKGRGTQKS